MNSTDVRSPLVRLPNVGPIPGRRSEHTPDHNRFKMFRAQVVDIHMDETGLYPTMTFTVMPLSGAPINGSTSGNIENVVLLQAGAGNLTDVNVLPGGIFYMPEIGSVVLCAFDGARYCIVGFYTGPLKAAYETAKDKEGRQISYNPGIELALNRLISQPPGWDVPWLFGHEPGDIILARDRSKVKVTDKGLILSSDGPNCVRFMKNTGEVLERMGEYEGRAVGWWHRLHYTRGNAAQSKQHCENPDKAKPPADAMIYRCDIIETTPYRGVLKPYLVNQSGHISRSYVSMGRSGVYAEETAKVIKDETEKKDYAMVRQFIAQPTEEQPSPSSEKEGERQTATQAVELNKTDFEVYDKQIDATGNFRIRAGNKKKKKNGQGVKPTQELDLSIEYDAQKVELFIRLGQAGAMDTTLRLTGLDTKHATAHLRTTRARIYARKQAVVCSKKIILKCSNLQVTGKTVFEDQVQIKNTLKVSKTCYAKKFKKKGGPSGDSQKCGDDKEA